MFTVNTNKIILARVQATMTIRELSKLSGVAISTINKIEKGNVKPNLITVGKIAKVLNINVEDIVFFQD